MFIQFVRMDERLIVIQENIEKITQQPRFTHDHAAVLEARMNSKLALFDARITRAEGKLESYKERLRRLETVTKDEQ